MSEFNLMCKRCGRIYEADEPVTDLQTEDGFYICDDCYENCAMNTVLKPIKVAIYLSPR